MNKVTHIWKPIIILCGLIQFNVCVAQNEFSFDGQVQFISSYSPDNDLAGFVGGRYIPKASYGIRLDSTFERTIDFEASANISGSTLFSFFDDSATEGSIQPYRIWARYTNQQFEVRVGLQKIDFGSASLLRPIQWFNQIDPRDPLQLTNGVYGVLGRYYFLNNANVWIWGLIGNSRTRGFDVLETNKAAPEFGGRYQHPTNKGEIAISYHYRTARTDGILLPLNEKIPEHRIALDGKWDLEVGLWFEAAVIHKREDLDLLTNQTLVNVGVDYTFGLGNGLNVILEHLTTAADQSFLGTENTAQITGATISYPFGIFDNLSSVYLYNWTSRDFIFNLIYNHEFEYVSVYLMAYYNPTTAVGFQRNDLVNQFSGPGVRIMFVYNH